MNLNDLIPGNKPKRVVELTSGTGTFTPLVANSWCRVTLQAPGGGGAGGVTAPVYQTQGAGGGGAGGCVTLWLRVAGATPYVVGAGGAGGATPNTAGVAGGVVGFANIKIPGGKGGSNASSNSGRGGDGSFIGAQLAALKQTDFLTGIPGGAGGTSFGSSNGGFVAGYPYGNNSSDGTNAYGPIFAYLLGAGGGSTISDFYLGGGGGGSSAYGTGGAGGNSNNAGAAGAGASGSGYGSGGGGGGNGSSAGGAGGSGAGGLILIEEFGGF